MYTDRTKDAADRLQHPPRDPVRRRKMKKTNKQSHDMFVFWKPEPSWSF